MIVIGVIVFGSVFFSFASNFGNFSNFESRAQIEFKRAIIGMAIIAVGGVIRGIGAAGVAGSGAILDPEQARRDLEPYSRMTGGMIGDALDEAGIDVGSRRRTTADRVVMIKCRSCGKLNEEDSKFCQECGTHI